MQPMTLTRSYTITTETLLICAAKLKFAGQQRPRQLLAQSMQDQQFTKQQQQRSRAPTRKQTNVQPRIELSTKNNANNIICSNYQYKANQQATTQPIISTRAVLPPIKASQLPTIIQTTNNDIYIDNLPKI